VKGVVGGKWGSQDDTTGSAARERVGRRAEGRNATAGDALSQQRAGRSGWAVPSGAAAAAAAATTNKTGAGACACDPWTRPVQQRRAPAAPRKPRARWRDCLKAPARKRNPFLPALQAPAPGQILRTSGRPHIDPNAGPQSRSSDLPPCSPARAPPTLGPRLGPPSHAASSAAQSGRPRPASCSARSQRDREGAASQRGSAWTRAPCAVRPFQRPPWLMARKAPLRRA
jgi:hypothetical protein